MSAKELVLVNGVVHTLDDTRPRAQALAIAGGRVVCVADDATARAAVSGRAEVIDLRGACVVPGLADAHMHLQHYALSLRRAPVEQPTLGEALAQVKRFADREPVGAWILGWGWNHNTWGGAFPTAADLDRIAPQHPVRLGAKSGHAAWCNSLALKLAGIDATTADPPGGQIVRDDAGQPTGILLEEAIGLVDRQIPEPDLDEVVSAMREALASANRLGITMVHDMDGAMALRAEQVLRERGQLTVRVLKSVPLDLLEEAIALGIRTGFGDDWLRIGQVKMFADGALGPRTAWMLQGYASAPDDFGIPTTPLEAMAEAVRRANANGLGCAIHAIGDRACREVLDIYEREGRNGVLRNRVEHAQILHPDDQQRFAQLGVVASMQPIHATSDMDISDRHLGERAGRAYVFRRLYDSGAHLAFGSDCPVEVIDPRVGIHAAVTRRRANGQPDTDGWHPEQRLSVRQALLGFTRGPAYAAGMEERLGILAPGMLADAVILGADLMAIEPMDILSVPVKGTLVGGDLVWRDSDLA